VVSEHVVAICDETGATIARRKCRPTCSSFEAVEAAALAGAAEGTRLEVIIEPTGAAWLPVAVFFARRGHAVFRVSSQKAADLRRFLSRHAKSNAIDAETLARLGIVDPEHLHPLELPGAAMAALNRRARAVDHLTDQIGSHKTRLRELLRHVMPSVDMVFGNKFGKADLAVAERYADPRALRRLGAKRLEALIHRVSRGQHGIERAQDWLRAAQEALELFEGEPAVAFDELAAEIATEARIIRLLETERDAHARQRETAYQKADPAQLARTLPGVADAGGPMLVATMGNPHRFADGAAFKAFTGLAPRANGTGDSDAKGQRMSKAGSSRLRDQLVCSANVARKLDPQLAHVYWVQMVERGAHHTKALCVVAARLAERSWTVMARGEPYVIRDIDDTPVTPIEARRIIAERYTVPDEVRRRRRSRNRRIAGKAPQRVLEAHG
jgi:transposase